ncbi:uncharacterized protein LOC111132615 [Crassostrea virginica]
MANRGLAVVAIICSFGICAYGSKNFAFNPMYLELDGNRSTCLTTVGSYPNEQFRLIAAPEPYAISRIVIEYKHNKTDELSGFYLFVANNCSQDWEKLTPVYRHQGPVLGSSRVAVTFPANAPEIGQCVRIYVNRTSAILPAGYSPRAKLDICNWEILGCRVGYYGDDCASPCPQACKNECNPDSGKCLDDVTVTDQEYHEVLCHDPSFLQDSLSIICVGDPLAQPVVIASSYSGNIESCPQRHSWEPLTLGPCYSNALNSLCYNDDVCTVDSQDFFMDNSTICLIGDVFVLKLQYRCQKVCSITDNERNVPFATLKEVDQSGAVVLHYTCVEGFTSTVLDVPCDMEALIWIGDFPDCRKKCLVTDIDKNASNADWWSNDTHLSYTCNSGYTLNSGNLQRTCLNDGTWSGTLPTCTKKTCSCLCGDAFSGSTQFNASDALERKIEEIKSLLTVDRRTTSRFNRSLESVMDHRLSAQSIGYGVGVTVLVIICGLICIPDIPKIVQDIRCGCH